MELSRNSRDASPPKIVLLHCLYWGLKVALQILVRKFYKNTKKSSLYSQSLLLFVHKPQSRKPSDNKRNLRFTTAQINTNWKLGLFLHEQLAHLHTGNTQTKFQSWRPMMTLWKIITYLMCYGI